MHANQYGDPGRQMSSAARTAAERHARAAEEGDANGRAPLKATPVFGRAALIGTLALWAAFLLFVASGRLPWPLSDVVRGVLVVGSYLLGAGLAITSLVKKERPRFAVVTLCLLATGPLLLWLFTMLAWFGYGQGLQ